MLKFESHPSFENDFQIPKTEEELKEAKEAAGVFNTQDIKSQIDYHKFLMDFAEKENDPILLRKIKERYYNLLLSLAKDINNQELSIQVEEKLKEIDKERMKIEYPKIIAEHLKSNRNIKKQMEEISKLISSAREAGITLELNISEIQSALQEQLKSESTSSWRTIVREYSIFAEENKIKIEFDGEEFNSKTAEAMNEYSFCCYLDREICFGKIGSVAEVLDFLNKSYSPEWIKFSGEFEKDKEGNFKLTNFGKYLEQIIILTFQPPLQVRDDVRERIESDKKAIRDTAVGQVKKDMNLNFKSVVEGVLRYYLRSGSEWIVTKVKEAASRFNVKFEKNDMKSIAGQELKEARDKGWEWDEAYQKIKSAVAYLGFPELVEEIEGKKEVEEKVVKKEVKKEKKEEKVEIKQVDTKQIENLIKEELKK